MFRNNYFLQSVVMNGFKIMTEKFEFQGKECSILVSMHDFTISQCIINMLVGKTARPLTVVLFK
jgi:hypothetical protein